MSPTDRDDEQEKEKDGKVEAVGGNPGKCPNLGSRCNGSHRKPSLQPESRAKLAKIFLIIEVFISLAICWVYVAQQKYRL